MSQAITLPDHLRTLPDPGAGDLAGVLGQLAQAGRRIARELSRAALVGQLGTTGETNVQGEAVKKLDVWANDVVVEALSASGSAGILVSEEMAEPLALGNGPYVVCLDPVDGSSNLDVNGIVGTIFSIRRRRNERPGGGEAPRFGTPLARNLPPSRPSTSQSTVRGTDDGMLDDVLLAGTAQVAAGYIMYGPSTLMVLTTGEGVDGFTLDPVGGEFVRSHPRIRIPARGRVYSVNEGNASRWEPALRRYIEHLRAPDAATGRPYSARYVGSLVADLHRTLLEGGVYLYPADLAVDPAARGKLRLLYEAAPMGLVAEQAGGRASTGRERILEIEPSAPHQRVPLIIGSPEDVALAEDFIAGRR